MSAMVSARNGAPHRLGCLVTAVCTRAHAARAFGTTQSGQRCTLARSANGHDMLNGM